MGGSVIVGGSVGIKACGVEKAGAELIIGIK
jgi:hypothetical protein